MAFRISRETVKSECACEWGGWGRVSVDGPGQNNPDRSEGLWGRAANATRTVASHRAGRSDSERRERRCQRETRRADANQDVLGRRCLKCRPSSRTGVNPPYGMIGGTLETD